MNRRPATALKLLFVICTGGFALTGCGAPAAPAVPAGPPLVNWEGSIPSRQQVVKMSLRQDATAVSGTGSVGQLTEVGVEELVVAGSRRGDTLDVGFSRGGVGRFRFLGAFQAEIRVAGFLNGSEYQNVAIAFTRK